MKLYLAPGACSLAGHIALHEAGIDFERIEVDLKTHRTKGGEDYTQINPKGYVPLLVLDDGQKLTENVAILDWISHRAPKLKAPGEMGHTRQLEMLAFISTEIHKTFGRTFFPTCDAEKEQATAKIEKRLAYLAGQLKTNYLLGNEMTVADAYLYVMLRWANAKQIALPGALNAYFERMSARPAVKLALQHEGQDKPK